MRAERLALAGCLVLAALSACQRVEPPAPAAGAASAVPATEAPASRPAPPASPASPLQPASAGPALAATATDALPSDVLAFIARRDQCDHFRGEEAYDAKRAAFLAAALQRTCHGSDRALATLRQQHAGNAAVQAALKDYDDHIE